MNGQVPDRYHEHVLTTPREVRNVLAYVLKNWNRHAKAFTRMLDELASGPWFDGWGEDFEVAGNALRDPPIVPAETWLLKVGWRRHGLVPVVAHD